MVFTSVIGVILFVLYLGLLSLCQMSEFMRTLYTFNRGARWPSGLERWTGD